LEENVVQECKRTKETYKAKKQNDEIEQQGI
jgi:hypothetical protein